jgi:hypothetical protein
MKTINVRIQIALVFFMALSLGVEAGHYYVVIGTFSKETRAREFAASLEPVFGEASFRYDADADRYHVYVMETDDHNAAHHFRVNLQQAGGFKNAWIFGGPGAGGSAPETDGGLSQNAARLELYTGGAVLLGSADQSYFSINKDQAEVRASRGGSSAEGFTFVAEIEGGIYIPAKVMLMGNEGAAVSTFKTGEFVSFGASQRSRVLTFACKLPGYNTETTMVPLNNPGTMSNVTLNADGLWVVTFKMTKSKVDEMDLLYRGLFHSEAAVLQRGAKKQIDVLVSLMKSNPGWVVAINSHCHPGVKREIMLPARDDYFSTTAASRKPGSDKQLTRARAETVRHYLVANGIEPHRITVMGWGSIDLLMKDQNGNAALNERVEVEFFPRDTAN